MSNSGWHPAAWITARETEYTAEHDAWQRFLVKRPSRCINCRMSSEILILILLGCLFLALFIRGIKDVDASEKLAKYAQALLTLLALLVTGYWFFLERKGMPHADVSQEVSVVPVAEGLVAIEAHISVKNLGQRLLKIDRINSRLQLVRADAYGYEALDRARGDAYWDGVRPGKSGGAQFHASELRWPIHRRFDDDVEHNIEPGETDLIVVTFLMDCSMAKWVRVASDVYNPEGSDDLMSGLESEDEEEERFAWKTRSFVEVANVCEQGGDRDAG